MVQTRISLRYGLVVLGALLVILGASLGILAHRDVTRSQAWLAGLSAEVERLDAQQRYPEAMRDTVRLKQELSARRGAVALAEFHVGRARAERAAVWQWHGPGTLLVLAGTVLLAASVALRRRLADVGHPKRR